MTTEQKPAPLLEVLDYYFFRKQSIEKTKLDPVFCPVCFRAADPKLPVTECCQAAPIPKAEALENIQQIHDIILQDIQDPEETKQPRIKKDREPKAPKEYSEDTKITILRGDSKREFPDARAARKYLRKEGIPLDKVNRPSNIWIC